MPVVDLAREAARRYVDGLPLSARVKALLRSVSGSIRSSLVEVVVTVARGSRRCRMRSHKIRAMRSSLSHPSAYFLRFARKTIAARAKSHRRRRRHRGDGEFAPLDTG